jgi:Protein of unknown function (DUF3768)
MNIQHEKAAADKRTDTIRDLNDKFRKSFAGDTVLLSASVAALNKTRQGVIIVAVRAFDDFTADNDPHGEHDFGSLEACGETIFWKIDTYDLTKAMHSPDAADPAVTARLLTIMLADDY